MNPAWRRGIPLICGLAAIATVLTARVGLPDLFLRMQLACFDALQRAAPWADSGSRVRVVNIDDESLRRLGQWPWSRSTLAALVRNLQDDGARAIAFDVIFAESDRTSPSRLIEEWAAKYDLDVPSFSQKLPDFDRLFAATLARGRVVDGFALLSTDNGLVPPKGPAVATIGGDPSITLAPFEGAVPNIDVLQGATAGHGNLAIVAGRDEVIRKIPLLAAFKGRVVPSLSLEALRVAEDDDTIRVRAERVRGPLGPITGYTVRVGDYDFPLDSDGSFWLRHSEPLARPAISAWRLLEERQDAALADQVRGRIVLIGASAIGLSDLHATPLYPFEPGVNLHARAIEQIMARRFVTRPAWAEGAEWIGAALLPCMFVFFLSFASLRIAAPLTAVSFPALAFVAWRLFVGPGLLFDPSLIALTIAGSGLAASFARYLVSERDARRLRSAFMHYLSPEFVDVLARDPSHLRLGGAWREMTFLFTDLEGFTSLTEAGAPRDVVALLNDYLDGLCRIAMAHGGTVDKIVGDAVHVMFNAPLDQPDHAERAVRCALAMDNFAQEFATEQNARGVALGVTRIGVNSGRAIVGNFGGSRRFDYTAHGDAVNIAARLEAANKLLGTRICIAAATADRVAGVAFLPIGTLILRGKSLGVDVVTPADAVVASSWRAAYLAAFAGMASGDEGGSAALMALYERYRSDPVLALHARRILAGERSLKIAA
jgi:adenylate cyclase